MIDIPNTKWVDTIKNKCNTKWNFSHVSAESFFENKHGNMLKVFFVLFSSKGEQILPVLTIEFCTKLFHICILINDFYIYIYLVLPTF